jgi:hypothetical protein
MEYFYEEFQNSKLSPQAFSLFKGEMKSLSRNPSPRPPLKKGGKMQIRRE